MAPLRDIREGAGDVKSFGSSISCSCCLCPIAVSAWGKRSWGKGPDQRVEKWTLVWSWFCTYSWSRQYQVSEGSLSPQAFQPHFAQQRDLAISDKGWMNIPSFSCLFIWGTPPFTKHLHSQNDVSPLIRKIWHITGIPQSHCALFVPPPESHHET